MVYFLSKLEWFQTNVTYTNQDSMLDCINKYTTGALNIK